MPNDDLKDLVERATHKRDRSKDIQLLQEGRPETDDDVTPPKVTSGDAPPAETPPPETPPPVEAPPAETPPAEPPPAEAAGEQPPPTPPRAGSPRRRPTVPLDTYAEERKERLELKKQLDLAREQLDAARKAQEVKTAPPAPAEQPDPEPDVNTQPIEHDQWELRQLRKETAALKADQAEIKKWRQDLTAAQQQQQQIEEFDRGMENVRKIYTQENPDFEARREFLREKIGRRLAFQGVPQDRIPGMIAQTEREFTMNQFIEHKAQTGKDADPLWVAGRIAELAEIEGYTPNGNGKPAAATPAAKTPEQQVRENQQRQAAGRSLSTVEGKPATPIAGDADTMTASQWANMSTEQRMQYRRDHPTFKPMKFINDGLPGGMSE